MKNALTIFLAFALGYYSKAQINCAPKDYKPDSERQIFGANPLWLHGPDTLKSASGHYVIYFCEQCKLSGFDKKGKLKWSVDLSKYKCGLSRFAFYNPDTERKVKGCDIYLWFYHEKLAHGINSITGKIKLVNNDDIKAASKN